VRRAGVVIALLLAAAAGAAAAAVAARDALYWDRPLPGVELREADLAHTIAVTVGGRTYDVRPSEALVLDRAATDRALWSAGRGSFAERMRRLANPDPPRLRVDPVLVRGPGLADLAERLSSALPRPRRAQIVNRAGAYRVVPAKPGDAVDAQALAATLEKAVLRGVRTVTPPLVHVEPELTTAAAEAAVARAKALADASVALTFKEQEVGTLGPALLARLVRFRAQRDRFTVTFDPARIAKAVEPMLDPWRRRAVNARFVVEGTRVRIAPSKPGLAVDGRWVADSVAAAAASAIPRASLRLKGVAADLTTREAEALGIRQRISSFTTDMGTSSANRIHNVHLMANTIDGTIVKPGETFSFNERVGPRTAERGFREGQMIIGSLLLPSIGGGVCQTATTLFNNAFELGLPIVRRYNHSFYISHYPMGRDATVSWGGPDLVFRNDLESAILITTSYTDETLTFSFWGTDPKRRVEISTGPQVNWRPPETTYALDPYAPRGSVRTVAGSNQSGFDVTVTRRVYERGKLLRRDAVTSNYIAVGPTRIYGPGSSIPGPYFVLPRV
jgi:vancomycin resistance protein YoaR